MACLDLDVIVENVLIMLPDANVLTCKELLGIAKGILISIDGEDGQSCDELLCKTLVQAAIINKAKSQVDKGQLEAEKLGDWEKEYSPDAKYAWDDFIDTLKNQICPNLPNGGYRYPLQVGAIFRSGKHFKDEINKPCNDNKLHL